MCFLMKICHHIAAVSTILNSQDTAILPQSQYPKLHSSTLKEYLNGPVIVVKKMLHAAHFSH